MVGLSRRPEREHQFWRKSFGRKRGRWMVCQSGDRCAARPSDAGLSNTAVLMLTRRPHRIALHASGTLIIANGSATCWIDQECTVSPLPAVSAERSISSPLVRITSTSRNSSSSARHRLSCWPAVPCRLPGDWSQPGPKHRQRAIAREHGRDCWRLPARSSASRNGARRGRLRRGHRPAHVFPSLPRCGRRGRCRSGGGRRTGLSGGAAAQPGKAGGRCARAGGWLRDRTHQPAGSASPRRHRAGGGLDQHNTGAKPARSAEPRPGPSIEDPPPPAVNGVHGYWVAGIPASR